MSLNDIVNKTSEILEKISEENLKKQENAKNLLDFFDKLGDEDFLKAEERRLKEIEEYLKNKKIFSVSSEEVENTFIRYKNKELMPINIPEYGNFNFDFDFDFPEMHRRFKRRKLKGNKDEDEHKKKKKPKLEDEDEHKKPKLEDEDEHKKPKLEDEDEHKKPKLDEDEIKVKNNKTIFNSDEIDVKKLNLDGLSDEEKLNFKSSDLLKDENVHIRSQNNLLLEENYNVKTDQTTFKLHKSDSLINNPESKSAIEKITKEKLVNISENTIKESSEKISKDLIEKGMKKEIAEKISKELTEDMTKKVIAEVAAKGGSRAIPIVGQLITAGFAAKAAYEGYKPEITAELFEIDESKVTTEKQIKSAACSLISDITLNLVSTKDVLEKGREVDEKVNSTADTVEEEYNKFMARDDKLEVTWELISKGSEVAFDKAKEGSEIAWDYISHENIFSKGADKAWDFVVKHHPTIEDIENGIKTRAIAIKDGAIVVGVVTKELAIGLWEAEDKFKYIEKTADLTYKASIITINKTIEAVENSEIAKDFKEGYEIVSKEAEKAIDKSVNFFTHENFISKGADELWDKTKDFYTHENFISKGADKAYDETKAFLTSGNKLEKTVDFFTHENIFSKTFDKGADGIFGLYEKKKTIDKYDNDIIDYDIIGESSVENWEKLRKLDPNEIKKIIAIDDFSDEDLNKLNKIYEENIKKRKIEDKSLKSPNINKKINLDNDWNTNQIEYIDNRSKNEYENNFIEDLREHIHFSETGKEKGEYNLAENIGDGAGISFGAYQFTEKSGNLKLFLKEMAKDGDKTASYFLRNFDKNNFNGNEEHLKLYLEKIGNSSLGIENQDKIFNEKFLKPAMDLIEKYKIEDKGSIAQVVDHYLNAGPSGAARVLELSNGDFSPENIAKSRKIDYENIIKANPDKKKYKEGWEDRVDRNSTKFSKYHNNEELEIGER